ncbi:NAD-dependent malic enzyme [Nocardia transvalensis]|uniref:NAD-dependent malic enzyme n=1 Tax=Nocardia transvalensis TaxID=37333 RepID=UPI001893894A|nr:NAD-dependent malic enzyme [Nocardia transvalensis]MBF6331976.1 NAD-dependent malic enzyme [Nocardia transvalensis]
MTTSTMLPRGREVLRDPRYNRGTAFTAEQRAALGLDGLLPAAVLSLDQQAARAYEQYGRQPDDLAKNTYLAALRDRNEILYYKLIEQHLEEMLPVVYDPVIAQAIEHFSHEFRRPDGVYLSIDDIDGIERAFGNYGLGADDVDLLVATDAEEILGIGDWGANGMDISIGKLAVYTAAAGIDPDRVIPVMLDVGTDRESLLNDPVYVGRRHSRTRGPQYDAFIDAYVECASRLFPKALLHFEDFGPSNARRILERWRDKACVFNDDMQGTGAVTRAAALAGMRISGTRASEQRVVVFGAGTAGVGIADQLRTIMVRDGLSEDEAMRRVWLVDKQGLLVDDMTDLRDYQKPYARPRSQVSGWDTGKIDLATVVDRVRPTILVGTSTVGGAFTEPILRTMAKYVERPMIFPLSNPTERIEARPADVIRWTDGRGLVATGTPWEPVDFKGTTFRIGQANNFLVYPGIGLGTIVSGAAHVTDGMLLAASEAIAGLVEAGKPGAGLLPNVTNLREMSATVAVAVAEQAVKDGVAKPLADPVQAVQDAMWHAAYRALELS